MQKMMRKLLIKMKKNGLLNGALIGGIYVIECASVIVQVSYYKAFKKRVFLMAPLHHHFELKGWGETKVVMFYYLIGVIFAVFGTIIGLRI